MGLVIEGIKIDTEIEINPKESYEVHCLKGFERSLPISEIVKVSYGENRELLSCGLQLSYGGYNNFRNELSLAALGIDANEVWNEVNHLRVDEDYPEAIYHLINFADNEGFIGPKAVKELSDYFKKENEKIVDNLPEEYHNILRGLVDCIHETANVNGYLEFS